jgi:hypothetical protein
VGGGAADRGTGMTAKRRAYVQRNRYISLYLHQLSRAEPTLELKIERQLTEADLARLFEAERGRVPAICELLMCLVVDPEFHEDRLADFQERFSDLWVPRFGYRGAVAMYVWHVLRQSRLIDGLIRAFGWGGPL